MTRKLSPAVEQGANVIEELIAGKTSPCVILLQQGQTEWECNGRLVGHKDSVLGTGGRRQARLLGQLLRQVPLTEIVCSDLERSSSTARAIARANVGTPPVVPTPLLRAMALGLLEGELRREQSSPEATEAYRLHCMDEGTYRPPRGGECLLDVGRRVAKFLERAQPLLGTGSNHAIVASPAVTALIVESLMGEGRLDPQELQGKTPLIYLFFASDSSLWACNADEPPTAEEMTAEQLAHYPPPRRVVRRDDDALRQLGQPIPS